MRTIEKRSVINRRGFLSRSAGAAALIAANPVLPAAAQPTLKTGPASAMPSLVLMARDLYPHDRLPDAAYEAAVVDIDGQLAEKATGEVTMAQGTRDLDAAAEKLSGGPYLAIKQESERVAVLLALDAAGSPFFRTMRSGMITALYNQNEVWTKFGYEGSSAEKGGYLHRGFNDLDWLPA